MERIVGTFKTRIFLFRVKKKIEFENNLYISYSFMGITGIILIEVKGTRCWNMKEILTITLLSDLSPLLFVSWGVDWNGQKE